MKYLKQNPFVFFPVVTLLAGQLSSFLSFLYFPFNPNNHLLNYPIIYPPTWLFIVVWLILYPCMGISMAYIYKIRNQMDITGTLSSYILLLTSNIIFLPIMNISKGNPAIMTFLDFNGIVYACIFSWLCYKYSKTAFYWSLPLTFWMPITFLLKVALWILNAQ